MPTGKNALKVDLFSGKSRNYFCKVKKNHTILLTELIWWEVRVHFWVIDDVEEYIVYSDAANSYALKVEPFVLL